MFALIHIDDGVWVQMVRLRIKFMIGNEGQVTRFGSET